MTVIETVESRSEHIGLEYTTLPQADKYLSVHGDL